MLALEPVEKIDDDLPYTRQKYIQALGTRVLTEGMLKDGAQGIGDIPQVGYFDPYGRKGATRDVELGSEANVNIGYLGFGSLLARPRGEGFKELLGCNQQMGDRFLYCGELWK